MILSIVLVVVVVVLYVVAQYNNNRLHKFWQAYFIVPILLSASYMVDPDGFSGWFGNLIMMGAKAMFFCVLGYLCFRLYMRDQRTSELADSHRHHYRLMAISGMFLIIAASAIN